MASQDDARYYAILGVLATIRACCSHKTVRMNRLLLHRKPAEEAGADDVAELGNLVSEEDYASMPCIWSNRLKSGGAFGCWRIPS